TYGVGPGVHAQSNKGSAGIFEITNASNNSAALSGFTNGGGTGVSGTNLSSGVGVYGASTSGTGGKFWAGVYNPNNANPALDAYHFGVGPAVHASSDKGYAGLFEITNPNNFSSALFVSSVGNSPGIVIRSKGSLAGDFAQTDSNSVAPALSVVTLGTGPAIQASGAVGGVTLDVIGTAQVKVLQITGGADLAERFEVSEAARPGMVVAIDPDRPGSLCIARGAYNRRVAGVISGANKLD